MGIQIHPSFRELSSLADRDLDESRQRDLHRHLVECQRCRDQVTWLRDLGRTAREISHPSPPEDALSRILERRADGDRVILPVTASLRSVRRRKAIGIAAGIGGALLAATLLLLPANEATAGASDLRFDPVRPESGDRIEVTYVPTSALAAEEVLYLRGAFRHAGDPVPRGGLPGARRVELSADGDGTFSGVLHMPSDVVFGYFAVENQAASVIDAKDDRFWAIFAHEGGVPTRDALREQMAIISQTDVEFGMIAADMLLEFYPDDIVGWNRRLAYERATAIGTQLDSITAFHTGRLHELSRTIELRGSGSQEELEGLWRYAVQLQDQPLIARWGAELERTDHTVAAQVRLAAELAGKDVAQQLEIYEQEWMRAGLSDDFIVAGAFHQSVNGQDPEAVWRWARRHNRVRPDQVGLVVQALAQFPSHREAAKDGLRSELSRLETPSPERRNLDETTQELHARDQERIRVHLGTLGRLLLEDGRYEAAIDTLELAVAAGWNPEAFRSLADAYVALGDNSGALLLYAFVVAGERDLEVRREVSASVTRRFGSLITDESDWARRVEEAGREIARRLIAEAGTPIRPAGNPTVRTRHEEIRTLESLFDNDVAIVVFWTGSPWTESSGLGDTERLRELTARGFDVVTITENPQSTDLDGVLGDGEFDLQVFYDYEWEASQSLKSHGIPYHYVVDQQGRFYYADDMDRAIRLAESLRQMAVPAA